MAHCTVTMIGTHEDLDYIYENCTTDSSSETSSEQAFGYDYLDERLYPYKVTPENLDELANKHHILPEARERFLNKPWWGKVKWGEPYPLFTKKDWAWEILLEGYFSEEDVFDIRGRENWECVTWDKKNKRKKTKEEIIEWFKELPDDITFFFCDGHL